MKVPFLCLRTLLSLAGILLFSGCSTIINSHRQKEPMLEEYLQAENDKVMERISVKLSPREKLPWDQQGDSILGTGDEIMWRLEAGSMNFHLGRYAESVAQFKKTEELIADYDERARISLRDAAAEGTMILTNLNALPYRGFCRDRIALSIYKSLAYLGEGDESAFRAQLRRLRDEQKKVMEDYQEFFNAEQAEIKAAKEKNKEAAKEVAGKTSEESIAANPQNQEFSDGLKISKEIAHKGYGNFLNPAAIFLSGLGSIRDDNFENARIDFQRLYEAMPSNPMIQRYYVSVLTAAGREVPAPLKEVKPFDFPLNQDCVFIFFANGRSAAFKQVAIYFPVMTAWPMCEFYPAPFRALQVTADGEMHKTESLADMDGILAQEFHERLPGMITRIVLSTAVKEAAKYAATYAASQENELAGIGVLIGTSIYTALMNTADTRSWELLPKEFQLTQCPMPKDRTLRLAFEDGGKTGKILQLPPDCRSAIVMVMAPSAQNITYHVFPLNSK